MRRDPLRAGTVFAGRYEILSAAGRGGMGTVYRARHRGLAKEVALKVLVAEARSDHALRFAREARAVARLDHPNCVRVLDHGTAGDHHYIAMELLDGPTLACLLAQGPLPPRRAIALARQLLAAIAHAHGHGVIHRDIKPQNVMLVRGGLRAVLIDFGLASLSDEAPLTGAGMCVGSPSYIAPERLLGRPHDRRTDLYSIGVVLYEMISGVRPFAGGSPEETMRLALHRPPRPLRAVRRDLPADLDYVMRRALAKDPARRFADAEDMLLALAGIGDDEALAGGEPDHDAAASSTVALIALRAPSWWARLWSWLRFGNWRWRHG